MSARRDCRSFVREVSSAGKGAFGDDLKTCEGGPCLMMGWGGVWEPTGVGVGVGVGVGDVEAGEGGVGLVWLGLEEGLGVGCSDIGGEAWAGCVDCWPLADSSSFFFFPNIVSM
jgi:hypothetical protein